MAHEWLNGNADFIIFVYGLAFILLAAICVILRQAEPRSLPWIKLGLFGLFHGVGEWLEMLVTPLGDSPEFAALRVGVLALSFLFLLEFGREGWVVEHGKSPGRWIHIPLILAAMSGSLYGADGANVTIRYFLGIPSAAWASMSLFRASRGHRRAMIDSILAAVALAGFAIAVGVVVPDARLFPASILNATSFLAITGFPVQIVRAILGVILSASLWSYYQQRPRNPLSISQSPLSTHGYQIALSLVVVLMIGWIVTEVAGKHADRNTRTNIKSQTGIASVLISTDLIKALAGATPSERISIEKRLKQQLTDMRHSSPEIRWIYVLALNSDSNGFCNLMSMPDENPHRSSLHRVVYCNPPPELFMAYSGRTVLAGPLSDESGSYLAGFAPVREADTGRIIAVLVIDFDARQWAKDVSEIRLATISVTLMSAMLLIGFFILRQRSWESAACIAVSEATLQEERNLLRTLIDQLPDFIYVKDLQGRFLVANLSLSRMMGRAKPDELLGKTDADFYPADLAAQYRQDEERIFSTGAALINKDEPHIYSNGRTHAVLTTKIPMRNSEGRIFGLVGISRDITERKLAEEEIRRLNASLERRVAERTVDLTAANTELEAFTYSVSHDLRAPLRHIIGFLKLLRQALHAPLDPKAAECLEDIEHESSRMAVMLENLLEFSRMSRADMNKVRVSLQSLVETSQTQLKPETTGRHIVWKVGSLPDVIGDPTLLQQVFINLLDNAVKFTRTREQAEIEVGCRVEPAEYVIYVRDNGVGFDSAHAGKLFGAFQRMHTRARFEGTGVGLANVRRIIQRHGGRTWAESEEGHGATFFFSIPKLPMTPDITPREGTPI